MAIPVKLNGLAAMVCAALSLAMPAFADIKAYNAAVLRGDFQTASKEAETIWAAFDKTLPETVVTAREFAWTSMLAGRPDQARAYAQWLVREGPTLTKPDDDPLLSRVLLLWADLGEEPSPDARRALSDALSAWAESNEVANRITVRAASQLYAREWRMADWEGTRRDALLTAKLSARLGPEGVALEERAKIDAAAAAFLDSKKIDPWFELADVHDALMVRMGPPKPGEDTAGLDMVDARAHAWLEAMAAYFRFGQRSLNSTVTWRNQYRRLEEREKTLKSRCHDAECAALVVPGSPPRCRAKWDQKPEIRYPSAAAFRGMIGATILELTTNEAGAVTDVNVMAAVPSETFPDAALKAVKQWTLKKEADAEGDCTLAGKRRLTAIFQLL